MPTKVAVLTDSISELFYFPKWHEYYSSNVGSQNLYVHTYSSSRRYFNAFELGGVWQSAAYDNDQRAKDLSSLVRHLLESYDVVIRVDTDEFLVPDPRRFTSLRHYISEFDRPYATAYGYDVIPADVGDRIDFSKNIIGSQRSICYAYDALAKTSITCIPVDWAAGFHFSSTYPEFNSLYLLHLKRADVLLQVEIGQSLVESATETGVRREYYLSKKNIHEQHIKSALALPRESGWSCFENKAYWENFLKAVKLSKNNKKIYQGDDFRMDTKTLTIPDEFHNVF